MDSTFKQITWAEVPSYAQAGYQLIDVREPGELTMLAKHPLAQNIPMAGLVFNPTDFFPDKATKLMITCHSGGRSQQVCNVLTRNGYHNVVDVAGGMSSYQG
ncbi:putative rhodanese domain-containing protein [Spiroplasma syrphidicola EA-1]|uniref:Putative rhodanese domain-containing protein n=1 Tax=Spiroplasma syrphidicola EA-1 TaxID=1276229 RepID=R4U4A8_9MOLU|nr:rhodanese-like domain-containing protein [Spiroplasma syrphidicola]AGM26302.1 putative rhodanese domain-containing protein [Spiroplasma syrphidicola EA-1]